MCGRFGLSEPDDVPERFAAAAAADVVERNDVWAPRFNVAPSQDVLVVALSREGDRVVKAMRWGLVPFWTKDLARANKPINLRAENVFERPNFRELALRRRCLIPADGFYEWQKVGARRQPWHFGLAAGKTFAFAGLWDFWRQGDQSILSCTILTTTPNDLVCTIHDRMPAILPPGSERDWLNGAVKDVDDLRDLVAPLPEEQMVAYPVVPLVNDVHNEGADLRLRLSPDDLPQAQIALGL